MADSTTNLDLIIASQAQKEVTANAMFDATSPASSFGRRASTSTGLTWGYYGGKFRAVGSPDGVVTVSNGTLALTNNVTCYVYVVTAGAVLVTFATSPPTGWPYSLTNATALYQIVTSGGAVSSYTDYRLSPYI